MEPKKLAIEVDGPHHFYSPGKEENMGTIAKRRILEKKGWAVINIPYYLNEEPDGLRTVIQQVQRTLKQD